MIVLSGILAFVLVSSGAVCIMGMAALTDVNDRLTQWVMHKIWW